MMNELIVMKRDMAFEACLTFKYGYLLRAASILHVLNTTLETATVSTPK